jgi:hypothetical protein
MFVCVTIVCTHISTDVISLDFNYSQIDVLVILFVIVLWFVVFFWQVLYSVLMAHLWILWNTDACMYVCIYVCMYIKDLLECPFLENKHWEILSETITVFTIMHEDYKTFHEHLTITGAKPSYTANKPS